VLSSNVCELTDIIEKEKIGYTFKPYDSKDLSAKLIYLAKHHYEVKKLQLPVENMGCQILILIKLLKNYKSGQRTLLFPLTEGKKENSFSAGKKLLRI